MSRKIGRNEKCPCGSDIKFKKCHGGINPPVASLMKSSVANLQKRIEAQELIRQQQQGMGRAILAAQLQGHQAVFVGNAVHVSKKWKTFHDFLIDYVRKVLGEEWGQQELLKSPEQQHPILQWFRKLGEYHTETTKDMEITSAPMIGAVEAFMQLAYCLYLLKHNKDLQDRLIKRLKHPDQFLGAYYEIQALATMIKAGFEIEYEDESGRSGKRCECVATHKTSRKKYTVEAKAVHRHGSYGITKRARPRSDRELHKEVTEQLKAALTKQSEYPRIVFIEINLPYISEKNVMNRLETCVSAIKQKEQALPHVDAAYVFVTNHPHHYHQEQSDYSRSVVGVGFKIPDYGYGVEWHSLLAHYAAKKKHADMFDVMHTLHNHYEVPSTFDGSIPELSLMPADRARLTIGDKYALPTEDGRQIEGRLETATVMELQKAAMCVFHIENEGRRLIYSCPLTDAEIVAYKKYPDTFFGVVLDQGRTFQEGDYLGWFERLLQTYSRSSKEKLLEFMSGHPDYERLLMLTQEELALIYCEGLALNIVQDEQRRRREVDQNEV